VFILKGATEETHRSLAKQDTLVAHVVLDFIPAKEISHP
jgi:hypothetical protein